MDAAGEYVLFHMQMEGKERKKKKKKEGKTVYNRNSKTF